MTCDLLACDRPGCGGLGVRPRIAVCVLPDLDDDLGRGATQEVHGPGRLWADGALLRDLHGHRLHLPINLRRKKKIRMLG